MRAGGGVCDQFWSAPADSPTAPAIRAQLAPAGAEICVDELYDVFRGDLLEGPILLPRIHAPNCSLAMLELTAASGRRSAGSALSFDKNAPNTPIASRERSDRSVPSLIMMPLSSTTRLTPCCLAPATTFFAQSEMTVPGSRRTLHHVVDRDRLEAVPVEGLKSTRALSTMRARVLFLCSRAYGMSHPAAVSENMFLNTFCG